MNRKINQPTAYFVYDKRFCNFVAGTKSARATVPEQSLEHLYRIIHCNIFGKNPWAA